MSALYSIDEILLATSGRAENVASNSISSISIDSREIAKGALYVAIKGERFDGHDFVKSAIGNGAVAALISEEFASKLQGLPLIIVPDALSGLEDIAKYSRKRSSAKIIAVTGSAGKTSTKEVLRQVLESFGKTHASIRSFNNHWGVPLMLARMAKEVEYGIFEIGMNHAGEITPLSQLVKPDIAIITNVAPAHLEQLGSLENIALAKSEIFEGLDETGIAIINIDHQQSDILLSKAKKADIAKIITYGSSKNANVQIANILQGSDNKGNDNIGADVRFLQTNQTIKIDIPSIGTHKLMNASVALIVTNELGLDLKQAAKIISQVQDSQGRGQKILLGNKSKPLILIDESFNANPLSMQVALESFAKIIAAQGSKVLVLGDMLELGERSDKLHANLAKYISLSNANKIFLIGKQMRELVRKIDPKKLKGHANNIIEIEETIINSLDLGDIIMVKGSKGVKLASFVKKIKHRFGDE